MPTALVVDDSAVDRRLVGGLLEKELGWHVEYAENGTDALARIQSTPVDVVITDMQMPEMDGLNLVQAIRIQYSDLPVILVTGRGSESLAIEALQKGAASYCPKSQLAAMLPDTVESVAALVRADRSYESLIDCLTRSEFTFRLPNNPDLIDPLVDMIQQMIGGMKLCDAIERVRVGTAVEQALLNALFRGNLEITLEDMQQAREDLMQGKQVNLVEERRRKTPYSERTIFIDALITSNEARFIIRDDGPGFDIQQLPAPGDATALEREGGRGLVLMRTFMDEVKFNEAGNEVTMIKRRETAEAR